MKTKRISRRAKYTKEDNDLTITATISCIDFMPLRSLATLKTLNVLKILTVLKALIAPPAPPPENKVISKIESMTTPASK